MGLLYNLSSTLKLYPRIFAANYYYFLVFTKVYSTLPHTQYKDAYTEDVTPK
jgi:hypothetical protein